MIRIVFLFCFFVSYFAFSQHVIYVSILGNDKNSGSIKSPVYSLQAAFKIAQNKNNQPVDIKVSGGNYVFTNELNLNENISRTENTKIRVIGDPKNRPVLFGGNRIVPVINKQTQEWILNTNKSEFSSLSEPPQIISVNGKQRMISKFPSTDFLTPLGVKYYDKKFVVKIPESLNNLLKSYNKTNIKNVYVTFFVKWTNIIRYIEEHNYEDSTITFVGNNFPDYYNIVPLKTHFYVNNVEKKLNNGEWYYKDLNEIIYKPKNDEVIDEAVIYLASTNKAITITGKPDHEVSFLEFENIEFNTIGKGLEKSGYFPYQSAANIDAAIELNYSNNIVLKNIKVDNTSKSAIWIKDGCNDIKISKSNLQNLGASAIKIGVPKYGSEANITKNTSIIDNRIFGGGQLYPDAAGVIIFDSFLNTVSHNEISNFTYSGISLGWVWGYGKSFAHSNTVSYNHIFNIGQGTLDDLGGIYTLGISNGTLIENNIVHDVKSNEYGGWGIFADEGSSGLEIKNNLIYNCSSAGFHQHYGKNNIIENNIFAFNSLAELEATRIEEHLSLTFTRNIVVHKNDNIFTQNWNSIRKKTDNNIYFILDNKRSINLLQNESNVFFLNPMLKKNKFYYLIGNNDIFKLTKFKKIDFSKVGITQ